MAAASAPFILAHSGVANPDDAFGSNGDLFYTIPVGGLSLKLFQKIEGVWILVFELNLSEPVELTAGILLDTDASLIITWNTDLVPGDAEGRTYLEKHGPLEKVSIQMTMPDPANVGYSTPFTSWRFDEATKNTLIIDNQGQKTYYVIG